MIHVCISVVGLPATLRADVIGLVSFMQPIHTGVSLKMTLDHLVQGFETRKGNPEKETPLPGRPGVGEPELPGEPAPKAPCRCRCRRAAGGLFTLEEEP